MTEQDVQEILAEELTGKPTFEALLAAQHKIGVIILARFWTATNDEAWEMLKENTHAKCLSRRLFGLGKSFVTDPNTIREIFYLYEHWLKTFNYFCDNFESLPDEVKKFWPSREEIASTKDVLAELYRIMRGTFDDNKVVLFNCAHLPWMDNGFDWLYLAILGRENFQNFKTEFNQATKLVGRYEKELLFPSA